MQKCDKMYRSILEGKANNPIGFNGINWTSLNPLSIKSLSSSTTSSTSSSTPSTPITGLSNPAYSPRPISGQLFNAQMYEAALNAAVAVTPNASLHVPNTIQNAIIFQQRHYNYLLQQQQQVAFAHQQYEQILKYMQQTETNTQQRQQQQHLKSNENEIANSLQMFAQLSAMNLGNDALDQDEIMQEFATNGCTTDDIDTHGLNKQANGSTEPNNSSFLQAAPLNSQISQLASLQTQINFIEQYKNLRLCQAAANAAYNLTLQQQQQPPAIAATVPRNNPKQWHTNSRQGNKKRYSNNNKKDVKRCVFCDNNREPEEVIKSHTVRDTYGRVLCPRLRIYVCPICKASGDSAHTVKYCPKKPIVTMQDAKTSYRKFPMRI